MPKSKQLREAEERAEETARRVKDEYARVKKVVGDDEDLMNAVDRFMKEDPTGYH